MRHSPSFTEVKIIEDKSNILDNIVITEKTIFTDPLKREDLDIFERCLKRSKIPYAIIHATMTKGVHVKKRSAKTKHKRILQKTDENTGYMLVVKSHDVPNSDTCGVKDSSVKNDLFGLMTAVRNYKFTDDINTLPFSEDTFALDSSFDVDFNKPRKDDESYE